MKALLLDFYGIILQPTKAEKVNTELLDYLRTIQDKAGLYIFTSGQVPHDPAVQEAIAGLFKKTYTVDDLGYSKSDPEVYQIIAADLGVELTDLLFVDDAPSNVASAAQAGVPALLYQNNEELKTKLTELL
jgi:HAD superfamily hydrolase (TIGR01509 family)